ncbi:asparagine synthase (glutamine-hydrolyzing) [Paenibacillus thermotolerans]|uniref:asparagine synthase (glutamine-hydrolyzing) n=1 Tax=Paenibacillus thermotolerans TaxID=3027807 RepID=UPI0023680405|nr:MULTISPECIES: asparagine synthase (glutamine-hydrolyzing) [unclassified Paenibacillus]
MCGITGWVDWNKDLTNYSAILEAMTETMSARGPDASGTWLTTHCALGHRRLSIIDPANGAQPMYRKYGGHTFTIVYNGELYNTLELRKELEARGHRFRTDCDTEVLLVSFIEWGRGCVDRLNGIFAFAVWSERDRSLFLCRDRLGVKPLFYSHRDGMFLFGSEPKAILAHPDFQAEIGPDGLAEIFALGPARTPGHGVYADMKELKPGHFLVYDLNGLRLHTYWKVEAREHPHDVAETAKRVRELLIDTAERQLVSDVPVCTLLSGGLDSSALTAVAGTYYRNNGLGELHTYSVDYTDNDKHFKSSDFTPNPDRPWIEKMAEFAGTVHHYIEFDTPELVKTLKEAVFARDLPGMADVDASLLLFCREIKKGATVALSGEAADEIFGGYPWFHREDALNAGTFPWSLYTDFRGSLLKAEVADWIRPEQYVAQRYAEALTEVPHLKEEDAKAYRMREMSYLNITRFMPTLLDRKDRMSMAVGLEVRVPYCDHRLVDYVFNIPWDIKMTGNQEKGILRKALEGVLPDEVLYRKKSPYPKTHNPSYLAAVKEWMDDILQDGSSPLLEFVDAKVVRKLLDTDTDQFNVPWFGQLMTGPQLFAYLAQVDTWLRQYKVRVRH